MPAKGTMLTEATVIPRAVLYLGFRVDVQEGALLVAALPELGVKVALWHLGHVVFVQELTLVPFLAQSSQPVFAHNCLLATNVAEWAHAPFATGRFQKEFTDSSPRLIHAGEGQRLRPELLLHGDFQVELDVIHAGDYFLHGGGGGLGPSSPSGLSATLRASHYLSLSPSRLPPPPPPPPPPLLSPPAPHPFTDREKLFFRRVRRGKWWNQGKIYYLRP